MQRTNRSVLITPPCQDVPMPDTPRDTTSGHGSENDRTEGRRRRRSGHRRNELPAASVQLKWIFACPCPCKRDPDAIVPSNRCKCRLCGTPQCQRSTVTSILTTHGARKCCNECYDHIIPKALQPLRDANWNLILRASSRHTDRRHEVEDLRH